MSQFEWFVPLSGEVANGINVNYSPRLEQWIRDEELDGGAMFIAQTAVPFLPNPITPQNLLARTPYQTEAEARSRLENGVEHGIFTKVDEDGYQLTEKGTQIGQAIPKLAKEIAATLTPLPAEDAETLATLLRQLVDASLAANIEDKTAIELSRKYDPGLDAPVVERIRRYMIDLLAFRDDAHVTAWRAYDLAGYEWEAFSHVHGELVFGDAVATGAELAEKLGGFRGYDAEQYDAALQKVAERGWLTQEDSKYVVTAEGAQVRTAVEEETDRLFFAPWVTLSDADAAQLKTLMEVLRDNLQPPTPQQVREKMDAAMQAVATNYWPIIQEKTAELGFERYDLFITRRAALVAGGYSGTMLVEQLPYDNPENVRAEFVRAVEKGLIEGSDPYIATAKGKADVVLIMGAVNEKLANITAVPKEDVERLLALLTQLNDAIADAEDPANKPATLGARKLVNNDAPLLWQLGLQFSILNAFRDDVHTVAWQTKYDIPGHQWEAFSHVWAENVWGDPVATADAVTEKLGFRGYDVEDYTAVLQDCVNRGWLIETEGTYSVTEEGKQLRQEAEETTDNLFYGPWQALRGSDLIELDDLLKKVSELLQPVES